jgi:parvulin-like peptidyl-prolyl isomerase
VKAGAWGLLVLALCSACAPKENLPAAATVNGEPVSFKALQLEERLAGPGVGADELLDDLIDQTLVLQEGRRLGVTLSQDQLKTAEAWAEAGTDEAVMAQSLAERGATLQEWRDRLAQAALADEVVHQAVRNKLDIGHQEIQDYYWENLTAFRRSERRVLRQIYTHRRDDAEAALKDLHHGLPFAQVAAQRGQGPEAKDGGLLGPEGRLQLPKELTKAQLKLKVGQYSPLVHSPWGWHILYLESVQKEQGDSLDQATPKAHARLLRDKEQLLYQLWLGRLREQAKIERFSAAVATPAPTQTGP